MEKNIRKMLLVLTFMSVNFLNAAFGQDNPSDRPCVKMRFASGAGSEYAMLVMGAEEGKYTLDWGNGNVSEGDLHTSATRLQGITGGQDLTIYGNITVLECSNNQLAALDVTGLPALTHLISRKNHIQKMDLSRNPELKLVYVQDSPLESLDLTGNPRIDSVIVTNNRLNTLKLASHPSLEVLVCTTNAPLRELRLAECPNLRHLDAMQTLIEEYDLTENKELQYVAVGLGKPLKKFLLPQDNKIETLIMPVAGLASLDLSQTKRLKMLAVDNNSRLSELDLSGMEHLVELSCSGNNLSTLDLADCKRLVSLTCNNNHLSALDVSRNAQLEQLACYANELTRLNVENCSLLSYLDCSVNPGLSNVSFPASLTTLNCSECAFVQLETAGMPDLTELICNDNRLQKINVAPLKKLMSFNCGNNQIEKLDLANCTELLDVVISGNPIKDGIRFDKASNLHYVSVDDTQMEVCALDDMYRSLRQKRPGDDENEVGGLLLYNNVAGAAKVSKTEIATDKGWMVTVEGDGTGCQETGLDKVETENDIEVSETSDGWTVAHLPATARQVTLATIGGQVLGKYPVTSSSVCVKTSRKGVHVISVDGKKAIVCIRR
ncbi:MAG: DUF6383 domain-containing protein [Prevotella sp.]|nr:DUF6383 domain-containing protein [Prevotella sp.]